MAEFRELTEDLHPSLQEKIGVLMKNYQVSEEDFVNKYELVKYNIENVDGMLDDNTPLEVQIVQRIEQTLHDE